MRSVTLGKQRDQREEEKRLSFHRTRERETLATMMLFFEITEIDPVDRGTWKGQMVENRKGIKGIRGECDETGA